MPRDPVRLRECETGFFDELEGTHDDDGIEAEVPERESHSVASRQHDIHAAFGEFGACARPIRMDVDAKQRLGVTSQLRKEYDAPISDIEHPRDLAVRQRIANPLETLP